jgi:hypothetical protein
MSYDIEIVVEPSVAGSSKCDGVAWGPALPKQPTRTVLLAPASMVCEPVPASLEQSAMTSGTAQWLSTTSESVASHVSYGDARQVSAGEIEKFSRAQ